MATVLSPVGVKRSDLVVMSIRLCVKAIRKNKQLIYDFPNASGTCYQRLIAVMNDDKDSQIGLPCYECREIIGIGDEAISRRVNRTCKYYDLTCARNKNLI